MPPPPNRSLERGGLGRLEKASEDGVTSRAARGTRSGRPRRQARGWRPGAPGRAAPRGAGSLTCRPLGCLLLPPGHRSSSLQSHFWRPSPEPPRAGARCLARLSGSPPPPARWLPGRHSASVPLSPQLLHRGPQTPLSGWRASLGRPCRLV